MRPRRVIGIATAMATMLGGQALLALSSAEAAPAPAPSARSAEQALRADATGPVTIRRGSDGVATFVGTKAGRPVPRPEGVSADASPAAAARAHLAYYGALFGVRDAARDLMTERVTSIGKGKAAVRFQQTLDGLPVLGGEVVTVVDGDGALVSVSGETATRVTSAGFAVSAEQARRIALGTTARAHHVDSSTLVASAPQRWLYDPALVGPSRVGGASGVWRTEVRATDGSPIRQLVLVDATSRAVRLSFNQIAFARDRRVCDFANVAEPNGDNSCQGSYDRTEGGAAIGITDVNRAYDYSGQTYDFFLGLGRDSIDGAGMPLISATRYCDPNFSCPYQNAFWDGTQMTYGAGYANADDVVGHELSHGVTEHTSGLLYYYESGAINESLSDIFGELVDLQTDGANDDDSAAARWLMGEDLPDGGALRDMQDPGAFDQPDRTSSDLWDSDWLDAGGVHQNSGVGNKAAYLMVDGSGAEPGGAFNGKIVTALGATKVAQLYYQAEQLLTSGANYRDLYNVVQQACQNLAFGAGDCAEVKDALDAVEMNVYPANQPILPAAPAVCARGYTQTNLLTDDFNDGSIAPKWTADGTTAKDWTTNDLFQPSAAAGAAAFVSDSTDPGDPFDDVPQAKPGDRRLTMASSFTVPKGRSSFLRWRQAHGFDWWGQPEANPPVFWDGGFVEVSVNGGTFKALPVADNGYRHEIEATSGRKGFGGDSVGWYTSRANLSSFAGKKVRVRFRLITDGYLAASVSYGWWLDDLAMYSCRGPGIPRDVGIRNMAGPKAMMTWKASTPNPGRTIQSYVVKRVGSQPKTLPASARSVVFSNLTKRKTYRFTIFAKNDQGAKSLVVTRKLRIT